MKTSKKSGFTLVELMTVIGIVGILAGVVLVNMSGARMKAKDNAAFTQIASTQGLAFKCLTSGSVGVTLNTTPIAGGNICSIAGYSVWPTLTNNSNWTYSMTSNFNWCDIATKTDCSPYSDGTCGGSNLNGFFCYKFKNGTKSVLCTQGGCEKSGF